jgi:formamidopyrimidine-DNA glycosylase
LRGTIAVRSRPLPTNASMPELPEVETVRRSIEPALLGRRITGLTVGTFPGVLGGMEPDLAAALLIDRRVTAIRRRGKYLLFDLDDGSGIEIHLRMTGHLELANAADAPIRFQHLTLHFDGDQDLRFADQRKFGRVIVHAGNPELGLKTKLGPEPLSPQFTSSMLANILAKRSAPIKSALLDQKAIAGIGNIYADEALFLSSVHPLRPARSLTTDEVKRLHRNIRKVLNSGLDHRGTSFSSYRDGNGEAGENQQHLHVYGRGRSGGACPKCGHPLAHLVISARTSHFCPNCQKLPQD